MPPASASPVSPGGLKTIQAGLGLGMAIGIAVPLIILSGAVWWALALLGILTLIALVVRPERSDFLSPPLIFTLLWALCATVGAQIVSIHQRPWTATVWLCVALAPISFWLGDVLGRLMTGSVGEKFVPLPRRITPWSVRPLLVGGTLWLMAAAVLSAYEWMTVVGAVPLLSESWEESRMVASEGYVGRAIHAVAYSGILLAIVVQVGLLSQPRMFASRTWALWALWIAALGLSACWGSRHTLFIPLAAGVFSLNLLRVRLRLTHLVFVALAGIVFIAGVQFIRQSLAWVEEDLAWREVLDDIGYVGWPSIAAQLHQTFAMNFEIFRELTETFPVREPHHLGGFTFHWLVSLIPGQQLTLPEWQNVHWNTGFYGSLTSTYMGPLYGDFGVAGIVIWTTVFAAVMRWLYTSLRRRPSGVTVVWFSYLMSQVIMLPYDNTFVKLSMVLNFAILWIGLTAVGARRASPLTEQESGR
jgi:hypothetical protein